MSTSPTILFREDQRFRGQWLLLFVGAFSFFTLLSGAALVLRKVWMTTSANTHQIPDTIAVALAAFEVIIALGLIWLVWKAVLRVEVTTAGLFVRFEPFHRKTRQIDLNDVVEIEAVKYRPIRDYGGWGLRNGPRSRCLNVGGEEGVRIDYANGYHVLIGSQRATELAAALTRIWTPPASTPNDQGDAS